MPSETGNQRPQSIQIGFLNKEKDDTSSEGSEPEIIGERPDQTSNKTQIPEPGQSKSYLHRVDCLTFENRHKITLDLIKIL